MLDISGSNRLGSGVDDTFGYEFFETDYPVENDNSNSDGTYDGYPDSYNQFSVENDAGHVMSSEGGNTTAEAFIDAEIAKIDANTQLTKAQQEYLTAQVKAKGEEVTGEMELLETQSDAQSNMQNKATGAVGKAAKGVVAAGSVVSEIYAAGKENTSKE